MSIDRILRPELFFGIVAPVGVDLDMITDVLSTQIKLHKYSPDIIQVTKIMQDVPSNIEIKDEPYLERINSRIRYADDVCERLSREDALAAITISAIQSERETLNRKKAEEEKRAISDEDLERPLDGHAFIIRQFKRPAEINLMRQVYGKLFFLISAYGSPSERENLLRKKIKDSQYGALEEEEARCQAIQLMAVDYSESDKKYGQKVRETFPLGDVFVDGLNRQNCENMLSRFVRLIFGDNSITPTHHEYGMYLAKSASLRSGDLSRQVGAAIFRNTGEVISLGCNEVPKYGGGTYWEDDEHDARDFALGEDPNDRIKREILHEIIEILSRGNHLAENLNDIGSPKKIMTNLLASDRGVRDSKLMDLLEFGRVIHAEMSALSDAARLGLSVKNAILFSTTFPCHICAKHIVATGVDEVVFLEPYPKSYAKQLHSDSIEVEGADAPNKVRFTPFMGISPFRYRDFFEKTKRKDSEGRIRLWKDEKNGEPIPIMEMYIPVYIKVETIISSKIELDVTGIASNSSVGNG